MNWLNWHPCQRPRSKTRVNTTALSCPAPCRPPNKYRDTLVQQLAARADNTHRTTRAGVVVATSVLNAFPAAMLGEDSVVRQTLEDVAALWGWHTLVLELLRFPEGRQDAAVIPGIPAPGTVAIDTSPPSIEARFVSCGHFVAGSETLGGGHASVKPAALRAAADVLLQPIIVRLSMLPEVRTHRSCSPGRFAWQGRDEPCVADIVTTYESSTFLHSKLHTVGLLAVTEAWHSATCRPVHVGACMLSPMKAFGVGDWRRPCQAVVGEVRVPGGADFEWRHGLWHFPSSR